MRRDGGSRTIRIAAVAAAVVLALLVLAQLVLPRIAASRISSRVGRYGHVEHVSVSAFPAIKLLWGDADSVDVRAGSLALSPAQAAALLWEGRGAERIDVSARAVRVGTLAVTDAALRKRGERLSAHARASRAAVSAALGPGVSVRLLSSEGGRVRVAATGSLFGVGATVAAVAESEGGKLVVHPEGLLLEGFRLTLFREPHVHVVGVAATPDRATPPGYVLGMTALLR
jgi:hypothetical protein